MNISIIIPVYNASGRLRHCLDSILAQDFDDFEVLLVDDGSNDGSGEICDEYAALDSRFKVFHKPNGGVSSARNLALGKAEGEYVMFVDSDDALMPGALGSMSAAVGDADFLLAGHIVCSEDALHSGSSSSGAAGGVAVGGVAVGEAAVDGAVANKASAGGVAVGEAVVGETVANKASAGGLAAGGLAAGGVAVRDVVLPDFGKSYSGMSDFCADNLKRNCPMLDAPWGKLFRRGLIGDARFCEELSYAEDKLFVFGYLAGCATAVVLKRPVYEYFVHGGSLGSDISSDRHLAQLRTFLPLYADVLARLACACPGCDKVAALYHEDLVGRYACRILNIFMTRKTDMLTEEYLRWLYTMMDNDGRLGIFSFRPGQILNIMLYKWGSVSLSVKIYGLLSSMMSHLF